MNTQPLHVVFDGRQYQKVDFLSPSDLKDHRQRFVVAVDNDGVVVPTTGDPHLFLVFNFAVYIMQVGMNTALIDNNVLRVVAERESDNQAQSTLASGHVGPILSGHRLLPVAPPITAAPPFTTAPPVTATPPVTAAPPVTAGPAGPAGSAQAIIRGPLEYGFDLFDLPVYQQRPVTLFEPTKQNPTTTRNARWRPAQHKKLFELIEKSMRQLNRPLIGHPDLRPITEALNRAFQGLTENGGVAGQNDDTPYQERGYNAVHSYVFKSKIQQYDALKLRVLGAQPAQPTSSAQTPILPTPSVQATPASQPTPTLPTENGGLVSTATMQET